MYVCPDIMLTSLTHRPDWQAYVHVCMEHELPLHSFAPCPRLQLSSGYRQQLHWPHLHVCLTRCHARILQTQARLACVCMKHELQLQSLPLASSLATANSCCGLVGHSWMALHSQSRHLARSARHGSLSVACLRDFEQSCALWQTCMQPQHLHWQRRCT